MHQTLGCSTLGWDSGKVGLTTSSREPYLVCQTEPLTGVGVGVVSSRVGGALLFRRGFTHGMHGCMSSFMAFYGQEWPTHATLRGALARDNVHFFPLASSVTYFYPHFPSCVTHAATTPPPASMPRKALLGRPPPLQHGDQKSIPAAKSATKGDTHHHHSTSLGAAKFPLQPHISSPHHPTATNTP